MKKEKAYNEAVDGDEGFEPGEGYPRATANPVPMCQTIRRRRLTQWQTLAEGGAAPDFAAALAEWQDKFIRLQAEFDNYRKRTLKEKMDLVQTGGRDVLLAMLLCATTCSVPSMPCRRATISKRCVPA